MKKIIIAALMGTLGTGCSLFGIGSEEQPSYEVIFREDNKEIRKYSSYIVARTIVKGSFGDAQEEGFRILAGYIFGKNESKQKISMTAPVVQKADDRSQKISMTAPVTIASDSSNSWTMTFSMPSKLTLETLPIPDDKRVQIEKIDARFVAALTFSGFWSESKNKEKGEDLIKWMEKIKGYKLISRPMFAGYNPPWTIPFLRRNEMLIELQVVKP